MLPAIHELAQLKQWVTWQNEPDEKGDMTKIPYLAKRKASSTKPKEWLKYDVACKYARTFKRSGVGFVFSPDDPYVGIDLDDCIVNGQVLPWAQEIIDNLHSYCEVSPSGNGVKLWVKGTKPPKGIKALYETGKIEIYGQARYFTVTEQHLPGTPDAINGADLDWLYGLVATLQKEPETIEPSNHKVAGKKRGKSEDPYAMAALEACLTSMGTATDGTRNDVLNATAYSLARLVAAGRLQEVVYDHLREAALQVGLSGNEIEKTLQSGIQAGLQAPNTTGIDDIVETPKPPHNVNPETGEVTESDTPSQDDRPKIDITNEDLAELVPTAWRALLGSEYKERLFCIGDELYLMASDSKLKAISTRQMRYMLSDSALWIKTGKKSTQVKYPPKEVIESVFVLFPDDVPIIERIVKTPVVTPQGHIVASPGYDKTSGYYLATTLNINVPKRVTDDRVQEALDLINDMLYDFPFKSNADYANAIALLLLPFLRGYINGATPLHLIEAAREGTGKGLLNDLFHIVWSGAPAPLHPLADNDDEVRKTITSTLEHMPISITFDNVRWINSRTLEGAITAQQWSDRIIGTGRIADVPVHAVWIATGNNVSISGDMPRRVVPIRLVAQCEQPSLRTKFKHTDILQWTYDHREQLIEACLTLIQYGLQSNISQMTPQLGSFTKYCTVMGKMLLSCGIEGFLTNAIKRIDDDNDRLNMWRSFFALWHAEFSSAWVSAKQVYEALFTGDNSLYMTLKGETDKSKIMSLGNLLKSQVDAVYSIQGVQYIIRRQIDTSSKTSQYCMVISGAPELTGARKERHLQLRKFLLCLKFSISGAIGAKTNNPRFLMRKKSIHMYRSRTHVYRSVVNSSDSSEAPGAPEFRECTPEQWLEEHKTLLISMPNNEAKEHIKANVPENEYHYTVALYNALARNKGNA